jgi:hypothetical protein
MKKVNMLALAAGFLLVTSASAQMSEQPGIEATSNDGSGQSMVTVVGKISTVDLSQGTLTLEDGTQLTLPPSFEYTSFPAIGDQVEVTYAREGENRVVREVDIVSGGDTHGN